MNDRDAEFIWNVGDMEVSPCARCRFYLGAAICAAFSREIPEAILAGRHKHQKPYPGDNGIQFEPLPESTPDKA